MKLPVFVGFVLFVALTIWGRRLREQAFRALPIEYKVQVSDKIPNYTSTEMIPFASLLLGFLGILLFRPGWLMAGFALFLAATVLLVAVLHVRAQHRFRALGLPATFQAQYEHSRIVTYTAAGVPLAITAWVLYL
jgi:hypothetical protein